MINETQDQKIELAIGCIKAAKSVLYKLRNDDFLDYESDINGDWGRLLVASEACMRLTQQLEQLKIDLIGTADIEPQENTGEYDEENMTGESGFYNAD